MLPAAMDTCRKYLLRKWKIGLAAEFHRWFESVYHFRTKKEETVVWKDGRYQWSNGGRMKYQLHFMRVAVDAGRDWEAGKDAVIRAQRASWWEWDDGSRCFHWRWPGWYMNTIRDGLEVHFPGEKPRFRWAQRDIRGEAAKAKVAKKLEKMRKRRYIVEGLVESLTSVFAVDKVDDIRLVYNAAESGLNDAMVVPRFSLPTIHTHLRAVEEGTYMADLDVGEMFLNFILHSPTQPWAGVDLTHFINVKDGKSRWERWCRSLMGCKSSPYQAVQGMSVADELIRGDPRDLNNPF
jgi:hypothetical protein